MVRELPGNELELEMFGVERTGPLGREAGANPLKAFDGATQLQPFDPNLRGGPVSRRENGPHVRAQGIDGALEVLEALRCRWCAGQPGVDLVEQTAEGEQLLDQRLVGHTEVSLKKGGW